MPDYRQNTVRGGRSGAKCVVMLVICDYCGGEIEKCPSHIKKRNFCGLDCKNKFFTKTWKYTCYYCKKEFEGSGCDSKRIQPRHFCSRKCSAMSHRGRSKKINCDYCGKEKTVYFSQLKFKKHFCSRKCRSNGWKIHKSRVHFDVARRRLGIKGEITEEMIPLIELGFLLYQLRKEIKYANQKHSRIKESYQRGD